MTFLSGLSENETRKRLMEQTDKTGSQLLELAEAFERVGTGVQTVSRQHGEYIHDVDHTNVARQSHGQSFRRNDHKSRHEGKSFKNLPARKYNEQKWSNKSKKVRFNDDRNHGEGNRKPDRNAQKSNPYCHICKKKGHWTDDVSTMLCGIRMQRK